MNKTKEYKVNNLISQVYKLNFSVDAVDVLFLMFLKVCTIHRQISTIIDRTFFTMVIFTFWREILRRELSSWKFCAKV